MARGGSRPGAGRKPLENGRTTVSVTLADAELIDRWQVEHGCKNRSEALRQMLAVLGGVVCRHDGRDGEQP